MKRTRGGDEEELAATASARKGVRTGKGARGRRRKSSERRRRGLKRSRWSLLRQKTNG